VRVISDKPSEHEHEIPTDKKGTQFQSLPCQSKVPSGVATHSLWRRKL
jgi:hypothetical protein